MRATTFHSIGPCGAYDPYPALTGGDFVLEGEGPVESGDLLHHNLVADYLTQLDEPYDTSIKNSVGDWQIVNGMLRLDYSKVSVTKKNSR
jgi:hypothetical protein